MMILPEQFFTVKTEGETVLDIQRSRFICWAKPVHTVEEAVQFIQEINRKHHDATHNCYAYVIDSNQQKSSDDGEPAGTAGRPILEVIHQAELLQTVIVITRYFGGIKLGAGGLVRAYRKSANAALEAAGITQKKLHQQIVCQFDYSLLGKIEHFLRSSNIPFEAPLFSEHVHLPVWIPIDQKQSLMKELNDRSQGQLKVQFGKTDYKSVT